MCTFPWLISAGEKGEVIQYVQEHLNVPHHQAHPSHATEIRRLLSAVLWAGRYAARSASLTQAPSFWVPPTAR